MSTAHTAPWISVEDYLEGELHAEIKHEYIDGKVYAMTGSRNAHNVIAGNVFLSLGSQLRGSRCRAFNSDVKIRIQTNSDVRFYFPDVSVACEQNPLEDTFQDNPVLVAEVLSESTRRNDEFEKRDAYFTLDSLHYYILLEQSEVFACVYVRGENGFEATTFNNLQNVVALPEIGATLPLSAVYEGVAKSSENSAGA